MKLEKYIDSIIENGIETNYWFMTKQTMSDYYFPFFIARIVENYPTSHLIGQNYQKFYTQSFINDLEASILYPKQCESENTYRNTIIAEYLGLIENKERRYATAKVTDAYLKLKEFINSRDDVELNRKIVDHQIEKIVVNVIESDKLEEVKEITIFPVIFLYKILVELYKKYGDSRLDYNEFCLFVMRTKNYGDYNETLDLIDQYRKHSYAMEYTFKINMILDNQSTKNVRFDALFGSLSNIDYATKNYYRIKSDQDAYRYVNSVIVAYEGSKYYKETNKLVLLDFMRSNLYFKGTLDNPNLETTLPPEEFKQLVEKEDEFLSKLKKLAEMYGEDGTTTVLNTVRLSSVQRAFRDKLIEIHGQKCTLCDVTNRDLLIASHIKQASVCNIEEKADYQNGFLLCAIHDKLFDKLLITFNFFDGKIVISPALTEKEKKIFQLDPNYHLPSDLLTPERMNYLMWHNEQFYKKEENRECRN